MHRFPFDLHVLSTPPAFILSQDQTLRIFAAITLTSLLLPERNCTTTLLRKATSNSTLTRSQARTHPHHLRIRPNPEAAFSSLLDFVYLATLQLLMCHNPVTLLHPCLVRQIPIPLFHNDIDRLPPMSSSQTLCQQP